MNALIDFINSHDGCKVEQICNTGNALEVSSLVCFKGQVSKVSEQIPATLKAARDWLGY